MALTRAPYARTCSRELTDSAFSPGGLPPPAAYDEEIAGPAQGAAERIDAGGAIRYNPEGAPPPADAGADGRAQEEQTQ